MTTTQVGWVHCASCDKDHRIICDHNGVITCTERCDKLPVGDRVQKTAKPHSPVFEQKGINMSEHVRPMSHAPRYEEAGEFPEVVYQTGKEPTTEQESLYEVIEALDSHDALSGRHFGMKPWIARLRAAYQREPKLKGIISEVSNFRQEMERMNRFGPINQVTTVGVSVVLSRIAAIDIAIRSALIK